MHPGVSTQYRDEQGLSGVFAAARFQVWINPSPKGSSPIFSSHPFQARVNPVLGKAGTWGPVLLPQVALGVPSGGAQAGSPPGPLGSPRPSPSSQGQKGAHQSCVTKANAPGTHVGAEDSRSRREYRGKQDVHLGTCPKCWNEMINQDTQSRVNSRRASVTSPDRLHPNGEAQGGTR